MPSEETKAAFSEIMESSLFRTKGPEVDLCESLDRLCAAIQAEPEDSDWIYLGEGLECDCASLIVGAYWLLADYHGGQASPEYKALCALGRIFSPGMSSGLQEGSSEEIAYEMLESYFGD